MKIVPFPRFLSNQGFSTIELVVAAAMLLAGISAAAGFYSYIGKQNQAMEFKRALGALNDGIRGRIGPDLKVDWSTKLAGNCANPTAAGVNLPSFSIGEYAGSFVDNAALTNSSTGLLSALIPNTTTPNPLYTAINGLKSGSVNDPQKCTQSTAPGIILSSVYNTTLCKCALAVTAYQTLQSASANMGTNTGFYSCLQIKPSSQMGATAPANLLKQGTVIIESIVSLMNVTDGSSFSCSAISTLTATQKQQAVNRLDYTVLFQSLNGANSFTIPGNLAME